MLTSSTNYPVRTTTLRFQPFLSGFFEGRFAGGEVTNLFDLFVDIGQEEVDEGGHLGFFLHDGGIGVDEQRAGQRIGTIFHVLRSGLTPSIYRMFIVSAFSV